MWHLKTLILYLMIIIRHGKGPENKKTLGEGNGNPLQYSCLENPRDKGAWWAAVYGVAQSQTWLKRLSSSSSRFAIAFLPRSKHPLISWLQSLSIVILDPPKIKFVTVSIVSPSICHKVMGPDAMILIFWMLSFKPVFHSPLSQSSRGSSVPLHFLPQGWYHLHIWGYWYFSQQSWFQLEMILLLLSHFSRVRLCVTP